MESEAEPPLLQEDELVIFPLLNTLQNWSEPNFAFFFFFLSPRSRGTILKRCLQSEVCLYWRFRIFQTLASGFLKLNKSGVSLILITLWLSWCPNISYKASVKIPEIGTVWKRCVKPSLWSWVIWMVKEMWRAGWTQLEGACQEAKAKWKQRWLQLKSALTSDLVSNHKLEILRNQT